MRITLLMCLIGAGLAVQARAAEPETGFKPIFDGKSLDGWNGDTKFWKVADGAIVGESTAQNPLTENSFLLWDRGDVDDFELRLKFRISDTPAANSGIQFRGAVRADGHVIGYQADIDRAGTFLGTLYDEVARGGLAGRGQKTVITEQGEMQPQQVNDAAELLKKVNLDGWNDYSILAQGNHITLKINGTVMAEVIDNDPNGLDRIGKLALQLHAGPPMKIEFKEIRLKRLPLSDGWKKVVFIAGKPSHAYFAHEHNAGCLLLAKSLNAAQREQGLKVISTVALNGWPQDATAFDNADTVVAYCDGGARHFLNEHLDDFDEVAARGVGLVCLHYGVETVIGEPAEHFLKWIGGYFEPHWSVNPHWTARFDTFPDHPISRGVLPFEINDEWYYHMRFVKDMKGVTPILTALPPNESLSRPDGPHSGNPAVRAAVIERHEPQHMAWAYDRTDGKGRGFGFTGGHNHVNWQHDDFRKLVLNAIVWTAHLDVPEQGIISPTPTRQELLENQDEAPPAGFQFQPPPRKPVSPAASRKTSAAPGEGPAPLFFSPVVTPAIPGHAVGINADITAARSLFLVVTDADDGIGCDWADWIEPKLVIDPAHSGEGDLPLTQLKWKSASCGWGETRINQSAGGGPLQVEETGVQGIGTHSNSIIEYELPAGHPYTRFVARGGIDTGGSRQGPAASVRFAVFTERPPQSFLKGSAAPADHDAGHALEQLDVAAGLEVGLFASEPMITNPASIDIDHLGRAWVCEAVNYRAFANQDVIGQRGPDRIVILEDTDGDARADKSTVFFSGPEVDSAHGILILPTPDGKGTQALISAGDQVFFLIDDDGDLQADRKEVLFTGIGGKQHDHGIHAFHFGPDGKLYFNFGNYGKTIKDRNGNPIVDRAGHEVNSDRHPYQEGMVFRCNLDGSGFETLAWNFRNNWEVCLDSFGTLWQSDNDDDGNRGVRINYVMEYGNYGYKDELTGASWQTPRTNQEAEIPLRHWHLNDPGVIPNFVQTGAGAPTGICCYEGTLLPAKFRHAPIHCDAGTNVCRAYLPTPAGAGYTGETVNILSGTRNQWFRPSDVCIAPDGSLMVADWYDPGVGGHRMMDIAHGRIFRIAPPSAARYVSPKIDVSTPAGAVLALQSPNMAARFLGWNALMAFGPEAEAALVQMRASSRPEWQARAIWALGKLNIDHARRLEHLKAGLADKNPDLRVCSIRLLRQLMQDVTFEEVHRSLSINDPSPAVRREFLIAIRELNPHWIPAVEGSDFIARSWDRLARLYDGQDRWYLEALGIAAADRWEVCLAEWMKNTGDQWKETPAGRDIVWRSRSPETPRLLATLIQQPQASETDVLRDFRSFDFQSGPGKQAALEELAFSPSTLEKPRLNMIRLEALNRLDQSSLGNDPQRLQVIEQLLTDVRGTSTAIQLINRFQLKEHYPKLLALAQSQPDSQLAVDAIKALFDRQQQTLIFSALKDDQRESSEKILTALATAGDPRSQAPLMQLIQDEARPTWMRQGAVKSLAGSTAGANQLLALAKSSSCPAALQQTVAAALTTHSVPTVRAEGLKLFPPPPGKDSSPLPPIPELAARKGNPDHGKIIFNTVGTCNKCHQVNGIGQEIGPNLSEIGKKLPKPALLEAILFPSAAISHGFENWLVATEEGQIYTGLLISETDQEIRLKDDKGIIRTIPVSEIDVRKKQDISLMPADLQKLMTVEELIDLVEYLTTLRERRL